MLVLSGSDKFEVVEVVKNIKRCIVLLRGIDISGKTKCQWQNQERMK